MLAEVTVKQVPAAFLGARTNGPAPPVKLNNWEFVTSPPETIRFACYVKGEIVTSIGSSTTRKHDHRVSCSPTRIKIQTCLGLRTLALTKSTDVFTYQSVNHKHCICLVIMLALGNDIPQLAFGSITRTDLNEIQVCTKVS